MARGISIRLTRMIDVRERRKDDFDIKLWTGTDWRGLGSVPCSPGLAADCGFKPKPVTTHIEFLPPGVVPYTTLLYQQTLLPKMRAMGVIK